MSVLPHQPHRPQLPLPGTASLSEPRNTPPDKPSPQTHALLHPLTHHDHDHSLRVAVMAAHCPSVSTLKAVKCGW